MKKLVLVVAMFMFVCGGSFLVKAQNSEKAATAQSDRHSSFSFQRLFLFIRPGTRLSGSLESWSLCIYFSQIVSQFFRKPFHDVRMLCT